MELIEAVNGSIYVALVALYVLLKRLPNRVKGFVDSSLPVSAVFW